jgi:hypothetical protein
MQPTGNNPYVNQSQRGQPAPAAQSRSIHPTDPRVRGIAQGVFSGSASQITTDEASQQRIIRLTKCASQEAGEIMMIGQSLIEESGLPNDQKSAMMEAFLTAVGKAKVEGLANPSRLQAAKNIYGVHKYTNCNLDQAHEIHLAAKEAWARGSTIQQKDRLYFNVLNGARDMSKYKDGGDNIYEAVKRAALESTTQLLNTPFDLSKEISKCKDLVQFRLRFTTALSENGVLQNCSKFKEWKASGYQLKPDSFSRNTEFMEVPKFERESDLIQHIKENFIDVIPQDTQPTYITFTEQGTNKKITVFFERNDAGKLTARIERSSSSVTGRNAPPATFNPEPAPASMTATAAAAAVAAPPRPNPSFTVSSESRPIDAARRTLPPMQYDNVDVENRKSEALLTMQQSGHNVFSTTTVMRQRGMHLENPAAVAVDKFLNIEESPATDIERDYRNERNLAKFNTFLENQKQDMQRGNGPIPRRLLIPIGLSATRAGGHDCGLIVDIDRNGKSEVFFFNPLGSQTYGGLEKPFINAVFNTFPPARGNRNHLYSATRFQDTSRGDMNCGDWTLWFLLEQGGKNQTLTEIDANLSRGPKPKIADIRARNRQIP